MKGFERIAIVTSLSVIVTMITGCQQKTMESETSASQSQITAVFPPEHSYSVPKETENLILASDNDDNSEKEDTTSDPVPQDEDSVYLSADVAIRYADTSQPEIHLESPNAGNVKWYSTDEAIATVDDKGVVKTKGKEGVTRIIATNGRDQGSCYVAVVTNELHIATPDEAEPYYGYYQEGEYNLIGCNLDYIRREMQSQPFSTETCDLLLVRVSSDDLPDISEDMLQDSKSASDVHASLGIGSISGDGTATENLDINGNPVANTENGTNNVENGESDSADQKASKNGDLTIDITTSLVYYTGDVEIPSNLTFNGKTYDITEVVGEPYTPDDFWLDNRYGGRPFAVESKVQNLTIPATVNSIKGHSDSYKNQYDIISESGHTKQGNAFAGFTNLESLTVKGDNFITEDDVLFTKDMKTLIYYPATNPNTEYQVPDSVTTIGDYAFYNCRNLEHIRGKNARSSTIGFKAFADSNDW